MGVKHSLANQTNKTLEVLKTNMTLLDDLTVESMSSKLNFLIAMDTNEYIDKTESARKYYMNHLDTKATHELIENKITEFRPHA